MASTASPDSHGDAPALTMTPEAYAELVDRVGAFIASALIAVALRAIRDKRGSLVAATSARSLAGQLHVAKDTAAGALSALVERGYLRRLAQPRVSGRFAPAGYVVKPPAGLTVATGPPPPHGTRDDTSASQTTATARRASGNPRRSRGRASSQLGLFAAESHIPDPEAPR